MTIKYFIVFLIFGSIVNAQNKCCSEGENIVHRKICKNGSNITGILCERMYIMEPETDQFNIAIDGTLIDDDVEIYVDRYCLTTINETGKVIALVCLETQPVEESEFFYIFRGSCAIISVLFLLLTITVYILIPNLRDLQGKCILHSISALALAMLLLCIMQFGVTIPNGVCETVGYTTFAGFLATFAWLNVISFHIWRTTVFPSMPGTPKQWYLIYLIYAYGLPTVMLLTAIIAHHVPGSHIKPGIGEHFCWFEGRSAVWSYFYGPILFLLILNVILFCWTIKKLWKDAHNIDNSPANIKSMKYKCRLYVKLFFIMGLSWIFEVLSFAFDDKQHFIRYIWMVTDFINSMQGVLIFLILVVFRKRALRGLAKNGVLCINLPAEWKTLQDEESEELCEDKPFSTESHPDDQLYKQREGNNTA